MQRFAYRSSLGEKMKASFKAFKKKIHPQYVCLF